MLLGNMLIVLLMACFGYGLGAIPFGLVLTRLAGLGDIRTIGSGNIGATNVLRTGNKPLAFATLLLDSGKGAIAIGGAALLVPLVSQDADTLHLAMLLAGIGAVLGHNYPIWLGFKGGKGVASTLGLFWR
jgi:glycerol-3-phosphate acyltransferase PlsY